MSRARRDAAAEQGAFAAAQVAKMHRARVSDTAAVLKRRAQAARTTGLESVTVHLSHGDARLVADVLGEWVLERAAAADVYAAAARRDEVTP